MSATKLAINTARLVERVKKSAQPCPFCGEIPTAAPIEGDCQIFCNNYSCGIRPIGDVMKEKEAVEAWNKRFS